MWPLPTYKWSNKKYYKLPAKLAEEILWNKICLYIIGPYVIHRNVKKEISILKDVTIVDSIKGCFETIEYNNKCTIKITDLSETT